MPAFNEITEVAKGSHDEDWANETTREEVHFIIEHYFLNLGLDEVHEIPDFISVLLHRLKSGHFCHDGDEVIQPEVYGFEYLSIREYQSLAVEKSMIHSLGDYLIHRDSLLDAITKCGVFPKDHFHFVPAVWAELMKKGEVDHYKAVEEQIAWEKDARELADAQLEDSFDSELAYGFQKWLIDEGYGHPDYLDMPNSDGEWE